MVASPYKEVKCKAGLHKIGVAAQEFAWNHTGVHYPPPAIIGKWHSCKLCVGQPTTTSAVIFALTIKLQAAVLKFKNSLICRKSNEFFRLYGGTSYCQNARHCQSRQNQNMDKHIAKVRKEKFWRECASARGIISKKYARCINLVRGAGQLTHGVMEYLLLTWRDALSQGIWHIHRTLRALAHEWLCWSWTENLHYTHTCSHSSHCIEFLNEPGHSR